MLRWLWPRREDGCDDAGASCVLCNHHYPPCPRTVSVPSLRLVAGRASRLVHCRRVSTCRRRLRRTRVGILRVRRCVGMHSVRCHGWRRVCRSRGRRVADAIDTVGVLLRRCSIAVMRCRRHDVKAGGERRLRLLRLVGQQRDCLLLRSASRSVFGAWHGHGAAWAGTQLGAHQVHAPGGCVSQVRRGDRDGSL